MALPVVNSSRYEVEIPSMGVTVEYRPFLVKEEKVLMIALESKDQNHVLRAIKNVLKSCIFDEVDVNNFASFDLEYIFLKLRQKSVGETVDLKLNCQNEECNNKIDHTVNLEEIKLTGLDKERIVMITEEVGIQFDYPSLDTLAGLKIDEKSNQDQQLQETMKLIRSSITNIFDDDNVYPSNESTDEELNDFLDGLNSEQFKKIADWFGNTPSLVKNVEYKCGKCGNENSLELRGLQSFFT
jgi:hypothetical protein